MTIGISKEMFENLIINKDCHKEAIKVLIVLLNHCEELDHWLPIENAPKDRRIHLFYPSVNRQLIHKHCALNGWGLYVEFDYVHPTHYKLLPEDPK